MKEIVKVTCKKYIINDTAIEKLNASLYVETYGC